MIKEDKFKIAKQNEIINEIIELLTDPIHRRIVKAYAGEEPKSSMELELSEVILEIWKDEDKKS
jgi:hypothetical protein